MKELPTAFSPEAPQTCQEFRGYAGAHIEAVSTMVGILGGELMMRYLSRVQEEIAELLKERLEEKQPRLVRVKAHSPAVGLIGVDVRVLPRSGRGGALGEQDLWDIENQTLFSLAGKDGEAIMRTQTTPIR